jgi:hypothetical protein
MQGAGAQVDVLDPEGDRLAGAQTRLGEQAHQGLVAAVAQRRPLAGGEQSAELLIGQDRDDLAVELRRLQAGQRVDGQLALVGQPGGEAAQGELARPGGGGLPAVVQQLGDERGDGGTVEGRRPALPVAPGEEGTDSGGVQPHGPRGLALGAQVDDPALQQGAQVRIGHADILTESAALHQLGGKD